AGYANVTDSAKTNLENQLVNLVQNGVIVSADFDDKSFTGDQLVDGGSASVAVTLADDGLLTLSNADINLPALVNSKVTSLEQVVDADLVTYDDLTNTAEADLETETKIESLVTANTLDITDFKDVRRDESSLVDAGVVKDGDLPHAGISDHD